jgi:hypothetical protein
MIYVHLKTELISVVKSKITRSIQPWLSVFKGGYCPVSAWAFTGFDTNYRGSVIGKAFGN